MSDEWYYALDPGIRLNNTYLVHRVIQRGGLTTVVDAIDTQRQQMVVVKIAKKVRSDISRPTVGCYSLAYEAAMLRILRTKGIRAPRIHQLFYRHGHACLVMQRVPGTTLDHAIRLRTFAAAELAAIIDDVAAIAERVHGLGYAHQDIKLSNIIVMPRGRAVLIDWGGAARIQPPQRRSGWFAFSDGYASIEQMSGQILATNDIYALGRTLLMLPTALPPLLQEVAQQATLSRMARYQSMASLRADLVPLLWKSPLLHAFPLARHAC